MSWHLFDIEAQEEAGSDNNNNIKVKKNQYQGHVKCHHSHKHNIHIIAPW